MQALFRRWGNNRHPPGWGGGVGWNRGCWCAREPDGGWWWWLDCGCRRLAEPVLACLTARAPRLSLCLSHPHRCDCI